MFDERAQSEIVGTMLMVATVVVSVTLFGGFALSFYTDTATDGSPNVDLDVALSPSEATVIHGGGGSLVRESVTVCVYSC